MEWHDYWDEAYTDTVRRSPSYEDEDFYRSGRPSKAWPEREGREWWQIKGPQFVESWVKWRESCGLRIWEYPDSEGTMVPGIELEVWAYGPDDLIVRSFIDRVMVDPETGELYIIDLKTGSHTPPWPLQLALNNLCLRNTFSADDFPGARWGGFWSARKGGVETWTDLSRYSDEWMWDVVRKAKAIRDQQLFIPAPNNLCSGACGVRQFCVAVGGDPSSLGLGATMTHNTEGNSSS